MSILSTLANHLWQSTLFAGAMWVLAVALRKNSAAVRYGVWMAASVKFLIPFALLVSFGGHLGLRSPVIVQAPVTYVIEEISQPFDMPAAKLQPTASAAFLPASPSFVVPVAPPSSPARSRMPEILIGLWLCGFAAGVASWLRWMLRMRAMRREAIPVPLHDVPIPVLSSRMKMEPCVFGIFKPVLLLPDGIVGQLTAAELDAIIAHELSHVRRRDNLTAAIHMCVETMFWFYPLLRWVRVRLIEERERACDEAVLQLGNEPEVYAESILKVCKFYLASPPQVAAGVTGFNLKKRIEVIVDYRGTSKLNLGRKLLLAAAGLMAVGVPMVVGAVNVPAGLAQTLGPAVSPMQALMASAEALPMMAAGDALQAGARTGATVYSGQHRLYSVGGTPIIWYWPLELTGAAQTGVTEPKLLESASLAPPQEVFQGKEELKGLALVGLVVDEAGRTRDVRILHGLTPALNSVAIEAISKFRFAPAMRDGKPVAFALNVVADFDHVGTVLPSSSISPPGAVEEQKLYGIERQQFDFFAANVQAPKGQTYRLGAGVVAVALQDSAVLCHPQTAGDARVCGFVGDPSGKAIVATVTATNLVTHTQSHLTTGLEQMVRVNLTGETAPIEGLPGWWSLALPSGEYSFTVQAEDYPVWASAPVSLMKGKVARVDARLSKATPPEAAKVMATDANLAFEVVAINLNRSGAPDKAFRHDGRNFSTVNTSLADLIQFAYDVHVKQIVDAPDWITKEKYDIYGVANTESVPNILQWKMVLQKMMANRFRLAFHHDNRDVSVYALSVAKGGPKNLTRRDSSNGGDAAAWSVTGDFSLRMVNATMADFTRFMQGTAPVLDRHPLDRPVLDRTGLTERYDFSLRVMPDESQFGGLRQPVQPSESPAPDLFTAIQEQLGLKLDAVKIPMDVIAVDHVERPSAD